MDPSNYLPPLPVRSPSTARYSQRRLFKSWSLPTSPSMDMDDLSPDDVGSRMLSSLLPSPFLSLPSNQPSKIDSGSSTVVAAASSSLPKVCITTGGIVEHEVGHHFYIVDLNRNTQDCCYKVGEIIDDSSAICVVGFKVYKFEAEDVDKFDENRKHVYRYELSTNSDGVKRLGDENREDLCMMKDTKFCPDAVPAPDGSKILVYSSTIRSNERCDFELFDVKEKTCEKLPKLEPWGKCERKTKTASVRSAFFRSASALLVLLETRLYSLEIDSEIIEWKLNFNVLHNSVPMGTPFEMLGSNTYLTPFKAYDYRLPGYAFTYPDLSSYPDGISGPLYPMLLDSSVPDQVDFCILHAGTQPVKGSRSKPRYIIDVYRCDLKEMKRKMECHQKEALRFIEMKKEQMIEMREEQMRKMKMKEEQKRGKEEQRERKTKKQKREEEQRKTKREEEELPGTTKFKSLKFWLKEDDTFLLRYCRFTPIIHNSR